MPELDKLAEKMAVRGVERVVMVNDQPMRLFALGKEAAGPSMPLAQLQALVKEVAPAHLLSQLDNGGQLSFPYQSSQGILTISAEHNGGKLQVSVVPLNNVSSATATHPQTGAAPPPLIPRPVLPSQLATSTTPQATKLSLPLLASDTKIAQTSPWLYIGGGIALCFFLWLGMLMFWRDPIDQLMTGKSAVVVEAQKEEMERMRKNIETREKAKHQFD